MLRMDQVHVIRHKVLIEGQSIRRVAREMGLSRRTVRKYLESSEPVRRRYRSRARPVWEQVRPRLEELVADMRAFGSRKNAAPACSTSPLPLTPAEPPLPNTCRVQVWADQSTGLGAPEPGSKSKSATDSATSTNAPAFTTAGSLTSQASISTSCRQRSRSLSNNRGPQLRHRNRDTDYAQQPKQITCAAAGGGKRKIK